MAATSGTLALSGTLADQISVSVAAETAASNLDLATTQSSPGLKVGTATFNSNRTSWKIRVWSTNGSALKNGSETLSYTFSVGTLTGGTNLTLPNSRPGTAQIDMSGKASSAAYDLLLMYTGSTSLTAGLSYTDTITIEIAAS